MTDDQILEAVALALYNVAEPSNIGWGFAPVEVAAKHRSSALTAITAYLSALEEAGWATVLKEPTEEMLNAELSADYECSEGIHVSQMTGRAGVAIIYKALLQASPPPPLSSGRGK